MVVLQIFPLECNHCCHLQSWEFLLEVWLEIIGSCCFCHHHSWHELPEIWEALGEVGFESGHAYDKALRTFKSCVGSTWCRYGVQDPVSFAMRVENCCKGIRSPHKMKSSVSGCNHECAEAQGKDFGMIATKNGYNLYVGGNVGLVPSVHNIWIDTSCVTVHHDCWSAGTYCRLATGKNGGGPIEHLKKVIIDCCCCCCCCC
jgi:nitrite reductase (NADH) large subunit